MEFEVAHNPKGPPSYGRSHSLSIRCLVPRTHVRGARYRRTMAPEEQGDQGSLPARKMAHVHE